MQAPLTCSSRLYPFLLNLKYWRHCCMQNNKINVSVDSKIHSRYEINWAHNYSRCKANWPITAKRNLCQSHTLLLLPLFLPHFLPLLLPLLLPLPLPLLPFPTPPPSPPLVPTFRCWLREAVQVTSQATKATSYYWKLWFLALFSDHLIIGKEKI